jgi:hypothetical protein
MDSLFTSFIRKGYLTRKSHLMDTIMDKASDVKQNEIRLALSIDQTKAPCAFSSTFYRALAHPIARLNFLRATY